VSARPPQPTPGAPADLGHILGLLGLGLTPEQSHALQRYVDLLQRWNATYNLTSIREPAKILTHHLADCLAIVEPLRRRFASMQGRRVIDVGSGAGLPGVVLAIALPESSIVCIDAVGKKAAFVREAAAQLPLPNLTSVHGRVEQYRGSSFDLVVSRAFASLADFVGATRHLLATDGWWLAMKGKPPTDELAALGPGLMFHVEPVTVAGLQAERCLVWMKPLP
jgi:16S rRNA (guanine527-N7)-methyltransferase